MLVKYLLAKGLGIAVLTFLSFMRQFLDVVVKADHFAEYLNDFGIAANNATDLTRNMKAVFGSICQTGLKLLRSISFYCQTSQFPWQDSLIRRSFTRSSQNSKFLPANSDLKSWWELCSVTGGLQVTAQIVFPEWQKKLIPFIFWSKPSHLSNQHLSCETPLNWKAKHQVACRMPKITFCGREPLLITHTSFGSARYTLIIAGDVERKLQWKQRICT